MSKPGARHHSTHNLKTRTKWGQGFSYATSCVAVTNDKVFISVWFCDASVFNFPSCCFLNQTWKREASDSSWWLSGNVKRFTVVGIGCRCCASGWLLYFRPVQFTSLQVPHVFFSISRFRALKSYVAFLPCVFAVVLGAVDFALLEVIL